MDFNAICPVPISQYPHVLMAHGGGGKLMHQLIGKMFLEAFRNPLLDTQHDAAVMELPGNKIAFTTDSYVVRPLFFPGGDIGSMAVHGTVNDLAMAGARPRLVEQRVHHRGRTADGNALAHRLLDARRGEKMRRANRHRRHEGGGQGQGRRRVHQHRRRRRHRTRAKNRAAKCPSRAMRSWSAAIWAGTAWPSWRCAKGWISKAGSKAIPRRFTKRFWIC